MLKKLLAASVAVNVVFFAAFAYSFGRHAMDVPEPSTTALTKAMQPMHVDQTWIKSGTPRFMVTESAVIKPPIGGVSTGLWSCDGPTTFEWTYGTDETVHIIEGEVHIDYLDQKLTLKAGDTAFFQAGTKATWTVPERVFKSFVLHDPGVLSRMYRRATAVL
jgi:uncharacterized cupin superfamily protein